MLTAWLAARELSSVFAPLERERGALPVFALTQASVNAWLGTPMPVMRS